MTLSQPISSITPKRITTGEGEKFLGFHRVGGALRSRTAYLRSAGREQGSGRLLQYAPYMALDRKSKDRLLVLSLAGAGILLMAMYVAADESGWVPHRATVEMYMKTDWLQNESVKCLADMDQSHQGGRYKLSSLRCPVSAGGGNSHTIPVRFWGQVRREHPASTFASGSENVGLTEWRCVRDGDDFTCYASD